MRIRRLLIAGLPPLALAALGLSHPHHLTDASAQWWTDLHVIGLPLFPLLAFGPWLVVTREHIAVRWTVALLGFAYACFYSALDVLAGIGAGTLQYHGASMNTGLLFDKGNALADYGVTAYMTATAIACLVAVVRRRLYAAIPALIVLVGAMSFLSSHIYWPDGVFTMLALAIGWTSLVFVIDVTDASNHELPARVEG